MPEERETGVIPRRGRRSKKFKLGHGFQSPAEVAVPARGGMGGRTGKTPVGTGWEPARRWNFDDYSKAEPVRLQYCRSKTEPVRNLLIATNSNSAYE